MRSSSRRRPAYEDIALEIVEHFVGDRRAIEQSRRAPALARGGGVTFLLTTSSWSTHSHSRCGSVPLSLHPLFSVDLIDDTRMRSSRLREAHAVVFLEKPEGSRRTGSRSRRAAAPEHSCSRSRADAAGARSVLRARRGELFVRRKGVRVVVAGHREPPFSRGRR